MDMERMKGSVGVLCLVIVLLWNGSSFAAVLFQDDFETATEVCADPYPDLMADYDPDNPTVGTWLVVETGAEMVAVSNHYENYQPPAAHSGDNYLIAGYDYTHYGNSANSGLPAASFTPTAGIIIDFWFYGAEDPNRPLHNYVTTYDSDQYSTVGTLITFDDGSPGRIKYVSGGWQEATSTWTSGIWNHVILQISCDDGTAYLTVNDQPQETIGMYEAPSQIGVVRFYSDERGYYDDILVTDVGKSYLTVQVSPSFVDTVTPAAGMHEYDQGVQAQISAEDYVTCPDTYVFDHWEGNVASAGSATTTVSMDNSETVTAHFVVNNQCGDACHPNPNSDLSGDCRVGLEDFSILAGAWLACTAPGCI